MRTMKLIATGLILTVACIAQAKKGDISFEQKEDSTGRKVILEVGNCSYSNQAGVNGTIVVAELPYAYCEEVRTYTAEVVDGGFFGRDKIKSISNEQIQTRIATRNMRIDSTVNSLNRQLSGQNDGGLLGDALNNLNDMVQVQANCENQRKTLELQSRHADADLAARCH